MTAFRPVIIIGAPRSGTNMLRDALAALPQVSTWPCDELPYMWKVHNTHISHDALVPAMATQSVKRSIRRHFAALARRNGVEHVVEKTCSNTLRIDFVSAVLPEATFVHIYRDGRDVTLSAARRWVRSRDIKYRLAKLRWTPPQAIPAAIVDTIRSRYAAPGWWGPRPPDFMNFSDRSVVELAAWQWRECVERSLDSFVDLDPEIPVVHVQYERFVSEPEPELHRIANAVAITAQRGEIARATEAVHSDSVGRWRQHAESLEPLRATLVRTLMRLGYEWPQK